MKKIAFVFVAAIAASLAVSMTSCKGGETADTTAVDTVDTCVCDSACCDTVVADTTVADSAAAPQA
mgnify:CR=1 FL=1